MPQVVGRTTPRTALAAMAASTALPPPAMTSIAALVARVCGVTAAGPLPRAWETGCRHGLPLAIRPYRVAGVGGAGQSGRPILRLRASSTDRTVVSLSSPWLSAEPTDDVFALLPGADDHRDDDLAHPDRRGPDGVEGQGVVADDVLDGAEGRFADQAEPGGRGGRAGGGADELLPVPQQGHDHRGPGAFGDLVDSHDGGAVVVGADLLGADLDDRHGAAVDGDAEAGERQGLDVADHLLGGLLRGGQHVDLSHLVALGRHPDGVDRRQTGEGRLQLPNIHGLSQPPHSVVGLDTVCSSILGGGQEKPG